MSGTIGDRITVTEKRIQRGPRSEDGDLTLRVGGTELRGWTRVRVTRSVERLPADFDIEMTDVVPGTVDAVSVRPGDRCEILIGTDKVMTGYVNLWAPTIDANSHSIRVAGRSLSQDLVDCNAEYPHAAIFNCSALQIAQSFAKAYPGLTITSDVNDADATKIFPTYLISRTDTPFSIIERACRWASLIAYDKADGSVLLTREGKTKSSGAIKQGENVERATHTLADYETFQTYNVYNQSFWMMEDKGAAIGLVGKASDPNVKRNRQKFLVQEMEDKDQSFSQKRATWESARRMGRGQKVQVRVDSWRGGGTLWEPNTLVTVDLPAWKVVGKTYVLGDVTFMRDDNGTHAELGLMLPGSYMPEPVLLQPIKPQYLPRNYPGVPKSTDPPGQNP